jgi:hypothetical protein
MFRKLRALIILAGFCAACGGTPVDVKEESTAAPLTRYQIYDSHPPAAGIFTSYSYQCASSTWYIRESISQSIAQPLPPVSLGTELKYGGTLNPARNEVQLVCPWQWMFDRGSYADSTNAQTCQIYSHLAGLGWQLAVTDVSVPARWLQYWPIQTGWPNGFFWVGFNLPTNLNSWWTGYGVSACFGGPGGSGGLYFY